MTISSLNELKFDLDFQKLYNTKYNTKRDFKSLDFILNCILGGDCNKLTLDMGRIDKDELVKLSKSPLDFTELYPGYEVTVVAKKNYRIHQEPRSFYNYYNNKYYRYKKKEATLTVIDSKGKRSFEYIWYDEL